jgi:phosphate uptake regulator
MFDKFKELFSSENLLDAAFDNTITMLDFDREMYKASRDILRSTSTTDLPFDVKQTDRKINKYERQVRRDVLTHLTVSGTTNLVPGLVLVSIVIDVERIGDYTKNIVDLAALHEEPLDGHQYEDSLKQIEGYVEDHFEHIIPVLEDQNKEIGRRIMQVEEKIGKQAEEIVSAFLKEEHPNISSRDAVAIAMYARYLKRINAHLTNIASAIVNPFPRIGFREKERKNNDDE